MIFKMIYDGQKSDGKNNKKAKRAVPKLLVALTEMSGGSPEWDHGDVR